MIVGVTGGIGAGKSSVSRVFEEQGAWVIDADVVGHETICDPMVIRDLAEEFGEDILNADGAIIRRVLGARAFASDAPRDRLNAIVWPPLRALLKKKIQHALHEKPERPVVVDAALLIERGNPKDLVDVLVVVTAPEEVRIQRSMMRLGISEAEARDRLQRQMPESEKVRVADFVVINDGSPEACRNRALSVWQEIVNLM